MYKVQNQNSLKHKLVLKLTSKVTEIENEVVTLIDVRKKQKYKYGEKSTGLVPKLVEFGVIIIRDKYGTCK